MTSFFNTTTTIKFTSSIPSSISAEKAISTFHNHEAFIKCDPHMVSYKPLPPASITPIPPSRTCSPPTPNPAKLYEVVDRVRALPAGLWDSDVVSTAEVVDLERGIFVRLRSPLSVVMETVLEVRDVEGGGLELVEESVISCSRLLAGIVRGQCEANWKGIHEKLIRNMEDGEA